LATLVLLATPIAAQKVDPGAPDTRVVRGTDYGTSVLNRQQAERAANEDNANVQNAAVYQRQVAEHNRAVAEADMRRREYEAAVAANNAQRAAYERARAQWEADVRACNAGDRSRCGTPQPR
jgi:hypothetical protein